MPPSKSQVQNNWILRAFAGKPARQAAAEQGARSEDEFAALSEVNSIQPGSLAASGMPSLNELQGKTDLAGSQDALEGGYDTRLVDYMLDVPDRPVRPFEGSLETSRVLMEMQQWSREARDLGTYISRDTFLTEDGSSGSWYVPKEDREGNPTPPNIIAVAEDLASRMQGKEYIVGGSALNRSASESAIFYGDSFLSLGLQTEGLKRNDYGIARSLRLPAFSVFVDKDEQGLLGGYWQRSRLQAGPGDLFIQPQNMLHFQNERNKRYGMPSMMQSIPEWKRIKRAAPKVERAILEASVAPWLHEMPDGQGERYRKNYRNTHQALMRRGLVSHLYLANGANVRQAAGGNQKLDGILDYWMNLRRAMIPAAFPNYLFPQLNNQTSGSKELANQPAQNYARTIAGVRASHSEQLEHALRLELTLKFGYEYVVKNHRFIKIAWPAWVTVPTSDSAHKVGEDDAESAESEPKKKKEENESEKDG